MCDKSFVQKLFLPESTRNVNATQDLSNKAGSMETKSVSTEESSASEGNSRIVAIIHRGPKKGVQGEISIQTDESHTRKHSIHDVSSSSRNEDSPVSKSPRIRVRMDSTDTAGSTKPSTPTYLDKRLKVELGEMGGLNIRIKSIEPSDNDMQRDISPSPSTSIPSPHEVTEMTKEEEEEEKEMKMKEEEEKVHESSTNPSPSSLEEEEKEEKEGKEEDEKKTKTKRGKKRKEDNELQNTNEKSNEKKDDINTQRIEMLSKMVFFIFIFIIIIIIIIHFYF